MYLLPTVALWALLVIHVLLDVPLEGPVPPAEACQQKGPTGTQLRRTPPFYGSPVTDALIAREAGKLGISDFEPARRTDPSA